MDVLAYTGLNMSQLFWHSVMNVGIACINAVTILNCLSLCSKRG